MTASRFLLALILINALTLTFVTWTMFPIPGMTVFEQPSVPVTVVPLVTQKEHVMLIPPASVLPEEPVVVSTPVITPAKPVIVRKIRHKVDSLDAPYHKPKTGVTTIHDESETMHPTRSYCTWIGNHKTGYPLERACFERDMITNRVYRTS